MSDGKPQPAFVSTGNQVTGPGSLMQKKAGPLATSASWHLYTFRASLLRVCISTGARDVASIAGKQADRISIANRDHSKSVVLYLEKPIVAVKRFGHPLDDLKRELSGREHLDNRTGSVHGG